MACHHVERRSPWSLPLVQICTVFRQKLNGIASSIIDRMVQRRIVVLIIIEPSCRPARPPDSSRIGQNRSRRVIFTVNERFWSAGKPGADVSRPSLSGRPRAGQSRITRLPLTSGRPLKSAIVRSTGFAPFQTRVTDLTDEQEAVAEASMPAYSQMLAREMESM